MNFPPQGTKCADCLHCEAAIYVDGTPICWHCDAGEPCPGPAKPQPKPEKPQAVETIKEVAPMPLEKSKRPRISEDTKTAIINADPSIPAYKLARQLGVSDFSVCTIRKKAGIKSTARGGGRRKKALTDTKQPSRGIAPVDAIAPSADKIRNVLDKHLPTPPVAFIPKPGEQPEHVTVTICSAITEERANAIFARFTPALKAIALQAGLTAAMEEA